MQCCDIILDTYKTRKEGKTAFDVDNSMKEKKKKKRVILLTSIRQKAMRTKQRSPRPIAQCI